MSVEACGVSGQFDLDVKAQWFGDQEVSLHEVKDFTVHTYEERCFHGFAAFATLHLLYD